MFRVVGKHAVDINIPGNWIHIDAEGTVFADEVLFSTREEAESALLNGLRKHKAFLGIQEKVAKTIYEYK